MTIDNWLTLVGILSSAAIGYLVKYFLDKKSQFSSDNAKIKREMYQEYVDFILQFLSDIQEQQSAVTPQQQKAIVKKMKDFHKSAVLYSSPRVINAYSDMLQNAYRINKNGDSYYAMVHMTNVFKEMRRDIGLSNRGLRSGAIRLMRPLINDYDTTIKPSEYGLLLNAKNALNTKSERPKK